MNQGVGSDIKISKTQIQKEVKQAGSLWSSLISLGTMATKLASKAAPALVTGALSSLGSLGIDKRFGKCQSGGFLIPDSNIQQLINTLKTKQKQDILKAIQTGRAL